MQPAQHRPQVAQPPQCNPVIIGMPGSGGCGVNAGMAFIVHKGKMFSIHVALLYEA
jgi:hypothetical protein